MVAQFAGVVYGLYAGPGAEHDGQGLVEYAIIVALTAVIVIVALIFLRGQIATLFSRVGNSLTSASRPRTTTGGGHPARPFAVPGGTHGRDLRHAGAGRVGDRRSRCRLPD